MGTILVVAEIQKGAIREASYELVAMARGLAESGGHDVNGLVIGSGVGDLASEFAGKGAGKTLVVDDARSCGVEMEVLDCDPELADTAAFCEVYGFSPADSANTIIVASKKEPKT